MKHTDRPRKGNLWFCLCNDLQHCNIEEHPDFEDSCIIKDKEDSLEFHAGGLKMEKPNEPKMSKGMSLFREFDGGQAVVVDGNGKMLRQLVKFKTTKSGKTLFAKPRLALTFDYKKQAVNACKSMHWPVDHITHGRDIVSGFWFVRYDFRSEYALACWDR